MCARFLSYSLLLFIKKVHAAISGCTDLGEVHPVSAQNKSLISDTANVYIYYKMGQRKENYYTIQTI